MTVFRYWITYTGKVEIEGDDENVALLAAAERHADLNADPARIYLPQVEVEPDEGTEGE